MTDRFYREKPAPDKVLVDRERLRRWQEVVEQAMACLRGETPEDVEFGAAEDDTFAKLRGIDLEIGETLRN